MGFAEFKKAQKKQEEGKFIEESEKQASTFQKDTRLWTPTKDKNGETLCIIRFLPQQDPKKAPYVKTFQHAVQDKVSKRWFIDECPWTLKINCPVCKYANDLYNAEKDTRFGKKTWYTANILVIKDQECPENNGKVFLYKFGKEIFKKIETAIIGDEKDDIEPIKVFNLFEGHNFRVNVSEKMIPGYTKPVNDYDKCRFENNPSEVCDGDAEEQEKVYNQIYDLDEFLDPSRFKSAEELQTKLDNFLGVNSKSKVAEKQAEKEVAAKVEKQKASTITEIVETEEDDNDDFFNSLDDDDDIPF